MGKLFSAVLVTLVLLTGDGSARDSARGSSGDHSSIASVARPIEYGLARGGVSVSPTIALGVGTFLGGTGLDLCLAVALDPQGCIVVVGSTYSTDFPLVRPAQAELHGTTDLFVAKLDPAGTTVLFSTYLGGSGVESNGRVVVDTAGNVFVSGSTDSTDFPVLNPIQAGLRGDVDAFLVKFDGTTGAILSSTYLGGSDFDEIRASTVDAAGNVLLTGFTDSADFPVRNALQSSLRGQRDAFVTKVNPSGTGLVYSTFFGGSDQDAANGIATDLDGAVLIAGATLSRDLPTRAPFQGTYQGGPRDAFVCKLAPSGRSLVYSSYLGGNGQDFGAALAVDSAGSAYVLGTTDSSNFPTVGAVQSARAGSEDDLFVSKFGTAGDHLVFSTYIGGTGPENATGISVDLAHEIYVVGFTSSPDFPTLYPIQGTLRGAQDVVAVKLNATGSPFVYATYLGGSGTEGISDGVGISTDLSGNFCIAGYSNSADFSTTPGAYQPTNAGGGDGFIARIVNGFELTWEEPDAAPLSPPRGLVARNTTGGSPNRPDEHIESALASQVDRVADASQIVQYKIYGSRQSDVAVIPANLFTSVPPTQTSSGSVPGGSFYVVTAVYDDGTESGPSNTVGAGALEPELSTIRVATNSIKADGTRFTDHVTVFLDGIPFAAPAHVKQKLATGTARVKQSGRLITGQTVGEYFTGKSIVVVTYRNDTGGLSNYVFPGF